MATNYNVDRQYRHHYQSNTMSEANTRVQASTTKRYALSQTTLTKKETYMIGFFVVLGIILSVLYIASTVRVASINRDVQEVADRTEMLTIENNNLEQNIQELSRYDRVYSIGEEAGLTYTEDNIRNVE